MFKELHLTFAVVVCLPVLCFSQEKIVLKPMYPTGKFLSRMERQDIPSGYITPTSFDLESFVRFFFNSRLKSLLQSKTQGEMIVRFAPPNEEGVVRVDHEITRHLTTLEEPKNRDFDDIYQRMKNYEDNNNRVTCEIPTWSLVDPKKRRVLEVHGYDKILEKLYETTVEPSTKEMYREMMIKLDEVNEIMRKSQESLFQFYPNDPISPGDQWKYSRFVALPTLGYVELEFTSVLKEIKTNQAGQQIAVVESQSKWKTDAPQKLGPREVEYFRVETNCDFVAELEVETGMEIFAEKQMKVIATRLFQNEKPYQSYFITIVTKQTETTTTERIEEWER